MHGRSRRTAGRAKKVYCKKEILLGASPGARRYLTSEYGPDRVPGGCGGCGARVVFLQHHPVDEVRHARNSQVGGDNERCNNVDPANVVSDQTECQEAAVAAGHGWYSFSTTPSMKCATLSSLENLNTKL